MPEESEELRANTNCTVKFTRIDNQAVILVNGREAWKRSYEGDPLLDADSNSCNIKLPAGATTLLTVMCLNWGGPSHLEGFIELGGQFGTKSFSHYDATDENGLSFLRTFRIKT